MTHLLKEAFKAASDLPETDQDALASRVLQEIAWEKKWDAALAEKRATLRNLVQQAREDLRAGRVRELDPDDL